MGGAVEVIKRREKPLSLYLFSYDAEEQEYVINQTDAGGVSINTCLYHAGHPGFGFGGVGNSGMGCYHGQFGFDLFIHRKPVLYKLWLPDGGALSDLFFVYPPFRDFAITIFEYALKLGI